MIDFTQMNACRLSKFDLAISFDLTTRFCKVEFNQPSCWLYSVPNFAYNLAINNPVFMCESCKGSVWKSVKKCWKLCSEAGTCSWISRVAHSLQAARRCTRVKYAEKLNRHASCSNTGQRVQSGHSIISWLRLATQSSREAKSPVHSVMKKWLFPFLSHSSINTPYTHEM